MSLLESAVSLAVWEAGRYFATGEVGGPLGSAHQRQAPYQACRTSDGWATLGAITPKTWAGLCGVLGSRASSVDDERFADSVARHARRDELLPIVEERTQQHPTAELVARLEAAGVPCAPIADYDQVFTDEHLAARDFFWDAPHPVAGRGAPGRVADAVLAHAADPRRGRAAARGPTLARCFARPGYGRRAIDALVASGAAGEGRP